MGTIGFWKDTAERAVKTAAQTLLTLFLAGRAVFDVFTVDWPQALGVSLGAALLSVLTSLASMKVGTNGTPSLVTPPPVPGGAPANN